MSSEIVGETVLIYNNSIPIRGFDGDLAIKNTLKFFDMGMTVLQNNFLLNLNDANIDDVRFLFKIIFPTIDQTVNHYDYTLVTTRQTNRSKRTYNIDENEHVHHQFSGHENFAFDYGEGTNTPLESKRRRGTLVQHEPNSMEMVQSSSVDFDALLNTPCAFNTEATCQSDEYDELLAKMSQVHKQPSPSQNFVIGESDVWRKIQEWNTMQVDDPHVVEKAVGEWMFYANRYVNNVQIKTISALYVIGLALQQISRYLLQNRQSMNDLPVLSGQVLNLGHLLDGINTKYNMSSRDLNFTNLIKAAPSSNFLTNVNSQEPIPTTSSNPTYQRESLSLRELSAADFEINENVIIEKMADWHNKSSNTKNIVERLNEWLLLLETPDLSEKVMIGLYNGGREIQNTIEHYQTSEHFKNNANYSTVRDLSKQLKEKLDRIKEKYNITY